MSNLAGILFVKIPFCARLSAGINYGNFSVDRNVRTCQVIKIRSTSQQILNIPLVFSTNIDVQKFFFKYPCSTGFSLHTRALINLIQFSNKLLLIKQCISSQIFYLVLMTYLQIFTFTKFGTDLVFCFKS